MGGSELKNHWFWSASAGGHLLVHDKAFKAEQLHTASLFRIKHYIYVFLFTQSNSFKVSVAVIYVKGSDSVYLTVSY